MIARDFLVRVWTAFNLSVGTSSCKNAVIWAWRVAQRERREVESPFCKS